MTSVGSAADGTVAINSGTTITYTPTSPTFVGQDSFTYTISDGNGHTATATVYVTVANGEWATSVIGESSQYTDNGPYSWYSVQALGTPNAFTYGDNPTAWAPEPENGSQEYLTVGFPTNSYATGVLIRETDGSGFVTQVDLTDSSGTYHTVWTGTDSSTDGSINDFLISFTQTTYLVQGIKIYVDTDHDQNNWEEIDAVKLITPSAVTQAMGTPTANNMSVSVNEDSSVNITPDASESDSTPLMVSIDSGPVNGTAVVNDNGTPDNLSDDFITYTPNQYYRGSDSFTYTATDIWGHTSTATVTMTVDPVENPPTASETFGITTASTAVDLNVLANANSVDNLTLTPSVVSGPAHGTASVTTVSGVEMIAYTPTSGFTGIDQFEYEVDDGNTGGTATAMATITVYPTGQWASSVVGFSSQYDPGDGSGDYAATNALGAPDTLTYGDQGTAWATADNTTASQYLQVGFTTPASSTGVDVRENYGSGFVTGILLVDTSGTQHTIWTGTDPSPASHLSDLVVNFPATSYSVASVIIDVNGDNSNAWSEIDAVELVTTGTYSSVTVSTVVMNEPPLATNAWASTNVNAAVTVPVLANDYDPDGDALTVTSVTQGTNGTVTIPSGGQSVVYTPGSGFSGTDTFTYTISDGFGGTSTATVNVTVANGQWASSVVGVSSEAQNGDYGASLSAMGPPDTGDYADTSTAWTPDPNSTATSEYLTVGFATAEYATGVDVREVSGNGFITEVDLEDTTGTYHTVWTGTDATAAGSPADFVITFSATSYEVEGVKIVVNPATGDGNPVGIDAVKLFSSSAPSLPTAPSVSGSSVTVAENEADIIPVDASASGGGQLLITIPTGPTNGTAVVTDNPADPSQDFITYYPNADYSGSDSFTYTVTDPYGQTASATVSVTVSAVNQPPVVSPANAATNMNTAVSVNVLASATDPDGDTLSITGVTNGQNGTVTYSGGSVTYTPTTSFTGSDFFTYSVSDGHGNTVVGTMNVTVYATGQWASSVVGFSTQGDTISGGAASLALGAPDTFDSGDTSTAWSPTLGGAFEYLSVGFTTPAHATGVLIREIAGQGSVLRVDLVDSSGTVHTIWTGTDPSSSSDQPVDFVLSFPPTSYDVAEGNGVRERAKTARPSTPSHS